MTVHGLFEVNLGSFEGHLRSFKEVFLVSKGENFTISRIEKNQFFALGDHFTSRDLTE